MPGLGSRPLLTAVAAGFLGIDGGALVGAGLWSHQTSLALVGASLVVSAALVLLYWRWHRRQLAEIVEARRALSADARAIQDLIRHS